MLVGENNVKIALTLGVCGLYLHYSVVGCCEYGNERRTP